MPAAGSPCFQAIEALRNAIAYFLTSPGLLATALFILFLISEAALVAGRKPDPDCTGVPGYVPVDIWTGPNPARAAEWSAAMCALGCAAIVGVIGLSSTKRERRLTLLVVWTICAETTIAYVLKAVVVPPSCPIGFGGMIGPGKRFIASLVRTVFWLFSTAPILLLFGRAAGLPRSWQAVIVANALLAVLLSTTITFSQPLVSWIVCAILATATQLAMLASLVLCCVFALRRTSDRFTFWAIITLGSLVTLSGIFYVVISMLVQSGAVSNQAYLMSLPFLDLVARLASACIFAAGNFRSEELLIERELALLERQRQEAEAANAARRQFVRWLFHECRIPLAALSLAVEEASELLPIVEANSCAALSCSKCSPDGNSSARQLAMVQSFAASTSNPLLLSPSAVAAVNEWDKASDLACCCRGFSSSPGDGGLSAKEAMPASGVSPSSVSAASAQVASYRLSDLEEPLRIARESAGVMQRLLDQVLMMSKIEAGALLFAML